jgi:hypothetical protein
VARRKLSSNKSIARALKIVSVLFELSKGKANIAGWQNFELLLEKVHCIKEVVDITNCDRVAYILDQFANAYESFLNFTEVIMLLNIITVKPLIVAHPFINENHNKNIFSAYFTNLN